MSERERLVKIGFSESLADHTLVYVAALNAADEAMAVAQYGGKRYAYYAVDPKANKGSKYVRIVMGDDEAITRGRAVHAFIVKSTGAVAKPSGWQGPAFSMAGGKKGDILSNYNLLDDNSREEMLKLIADNPAAKYGGYLYQR